MGSTASTDLQHYNVAVIATLLCSAVFRTRPGAPWCDVVRQENRMTWNFASSSAFVLLKRMESVGIRELRQHASWYVRLAKAGQRIPVTERGKLVAYSVPAQDSAAVLDRLAASGTIIEHYGR
jgi:antitoxin (DNA-binding transcriptional repressor) of toxin-antitoxin stability system